MDKIGAGEVGGLQIGGRQCGKAEHGALQAGQSAPVDLVTSEDFTIAEGAVLPLDYHSIRTHANPGEAVGGAPRVIASDSSTWLTVGADWTLPKASSESASYSVNLSNGQSLRVAGYTGSWYVPPTLPAGTVITGIVLLTILLSLPYVCIAALFAVFAFGIGLIFTARDPKAWTSA